MPPYTEDVYEYVLRWVAETRVEYVPDAKRPATKSFDRYARYSKATTVGEAFEWGSTAADFFNDHDRKIMKVVGGPLLEKARGESFLRISSEHTKLDRALAKFIPSYFTFRVQRADEKAAEAPGSGEGEAAPAAEAQAGGQGERSRPSGAAGAAEKKPAAESPSGGSGERKRAAEAQACGPRDAQAALSAGAQCQTITPSKRQKNKDADVTPAKTSPADDAEGSSREPEDEEEFDENWPEVSPRYWRGAVPGEGPSADLHAVVFDPAGQGSADAAGRSIGFAFVAEALDAMEAKPASAGVVLVNLFRCLLHQGRAADPAPEHPQGAGFEAELLGVLDALLPGASLKPAVVAGAVEDAFNLKLAPGESVDDAALAGRRKQQTLKLLRPLSLVEVRTIRQSAERLVSAEDVRRCGVTGLLASTRAQHRETLWLVRLLQGRVRCGHVSILRALAHASVLNRSARCSLSGSRAAPPLDDLILQMESFSQLAILGYGRAGGMEPVVHGLLDADCSHESFGRACVAALGVPMLPMRVSATSSTQRALANACSGPITAEWCYHGERIQLHVHGGEVRAFGADRQDVTELIGLRLAAAIREALSGQGSDLVVDAVVQGIDRRAMATGDREDAPVVSHSILDQLAGVPEDKVDPEIAALEAQLKALKKLRRESASNGGPRLFVFDLLWRDGELLTGHCLKVRRAQLHALFKDNPPMVTFAKGQDFEVHPGEKSLAALLNDAVASGHAMGIVLKGLDSPYEAGRRSGAWQALRQCRPGLAKQ